MYKNRLIIAAAGSGKTTFLVECALDIKDKNVLITTYTEANAEEIKNKIVKISKGHVPQNIHIQTWFSFLLQHGVRPYQSLMDEQLDEIKIGFFLTDRPSGIRYIDKKRNSPVYWKEENISKYYFTNDFKIYSDKISKFIFNCNNHSNGELLNRLASIFPVIYVDEIQDLAGWDLEILKLLFSSSSEVILVGDPRQVTYLTHHPQKHVSYKNGKIGEFALEKCTKYTCIIDTKTLSRSHRNNREICSFSSKVFPEYPPCEPCTCKICRDYIDDHQGVYLVKENDVERYCSEHSPTILRYSKALLPEWNYGKSKGLSFDRILIYPTDKIKKYLRDGDVNNIDSVRSKFYVALT